MILETERLILRPWCDEDAENLFEFASDPAVGPITGWDPHKNVEESLEIIRKVLSVPGTFAVVPKDEGRAVGSISLMVGEHSHFGIPENEAEIGYWLGVPFWGRGLIPEAVRELVRYGFEKLGLLRIWCGYFDGNEKSKRVQEKCGFRYHHTNKDIFWKITGDIRTEHVSFLDNPDRGNDMNARLEFNGNYLEICGFNHCPEDIGSGNPYNSTFDLRVKSGEFLGVGDGECDIKEFRRFIGELQELYEFKRDSVKLTQIGGSATEVEFILGKTGKITIYGTAESFTQKLEFEFEADQTALPPFIKGLRDIVREYGS